MVWYRTAICLSLSLRSISSFTRTWWRTSYQWHCRAKREEIKMYFKDTDCDLSLMVSDFQLSILRLVTDTAGWTWDTTSKTSITALAGASKSPMRSLPIFQASSGKGWLIESNNLANKSGDELATALSIIACAEESFPCPTEINSPGVIHFNVGDR